VGADQYAAICSTCHGPGGKGDGPGALGLDPKPRDHTDAAYMATLSDADIYTVIKCGGAAVGKSPSMMAWGMSLTDEQMRGLVCHLRKLSNT
jgi:mono/diheme cytochrome c family protein